MRKILVMGLMVVALLGSGGAAYADDGAQVDGGTSLRTATVTSGSWQHDSAGWHYLDSASNPVKGDWVVTSTGPDIAGIPAGEHRYWIDRDGLLATSRVIDPATTRDADALANGACAYATEFGFPATGKAIVGNNVYLAKADGTLETGDALGMLTTSAYDSAERIYYIDPTAHSAVVTKEPVMVSGFGWVFAQSSQGYLATGRTVVGNKVYLARENGKLETGNTQGKRKGFLSTKRYDGKKSRLYYIDPNTHAITFGKPMQVSKKFGYVYAPNSQGYLLRKSTKVDKNHLLLIEKSGRICNKKGWLITKRYAGTEQKYRIERTTANKKVLGARIGKFKVNGKRYYAKKNGALIRDLWKQEGNAIYRYSAGGAITKDANCTRMLHKAQGYSSPSKYLIMVDIDDPRCIVFEGSRGKWKAKFVWRCCTGHPSSPTITGTFSVGSRGYSFGEGNGYSCYYWTQISGDYLFHSQLYYPYTWKIKDPGMGSRRSHGCVRLFAENAHWIWSNVPSGTTVVCTR